LERKIERAIASIVGDETTCQRLKQFVEELKQNLQRRLAARRSRSDQGPAHGREIEGRPAGRDLDFWLQAEREFREARTSKPTRHAGCLPT
jgi:hypothetical protein